jgi:two-component system, sensor histidine kinase
VSEASVTEDKGDRESRSAHQERRTTLIARLAEAEETLRALRAGEVDALVVHNGGEDRVYTLHGAEEPYRNLVEQMREGAVVLTTFGDILYCNARFAALVGASLESVVGRSIRHFMFDTDWNDFVAFLSSGGGTARGRLVSPDRRTIEVYLSLTTTVSNGIGNLSLIVTDLSELLEARNGRDRAERDSRTKDEFLAMLAHELRNPLGVIRSAVQVLEQVQQGAEPAARAHEVIARQVGHLSHLIEDLLDVERAASGKIRLHRRPLDMAVAVQRAVANFTVGAALDRHIEISTQPMWIHGDADRIEQVLTNIVTNAVKYTPPGGRIAVSLRGDGNDAVLTVEDTGVGIAPELLPFVFDMFVQGDRTLDRAEGGLGIGLTLVHRLIELHGGTVTASSGGAGRGSTFTVRLPQVPKAETTAGDTWSTIEHATPRRVLLIEDSRDARMMFRMMLELEGHRVFEAADGVHGLRLLETERPDVAIIDIGLPGIDGYEVARRMRERPNGRAILLLALTGYGFPSDYERSVNAGFNHHLVKPVDPSELVRLLSESGGMSAGAQG